MTPNPVGQNTPKTAPPSTSLPWFRLYAEFATDPHITFLSFEDQRHFIVLLCLKCSGLLDRPGGGERRDALIAHGLGLPLDAAREVRARLVDAGLIERTWQPIAWDRRQYLSDVSTARTRAFRERSRNVSGTDQIQIQIQTQKKKNPTATKYRVVEGQAERGE